MNNIDICDVKASAVQLKNDYDTVNDYKGSEKGKFWYERALETIPNKEITLSNQLNEIGYEVEVEEIHQIIDDIVTFANFATFFKKPTY